MAKATHAEKDQFLEHNMDLEWPDLLEWIIDLLPQEDFDRYIRDINKDKEP